MKRKRQEQSQAADETAAGQTTATVEAENSQATGREPGDERSYPPTPNPFGSHHDNVAGVEISNYADKENKIYETWLKFRDGKPTEKVRTYMKDNGFIWNRDVPKGGIFDVAGAWTLKIPYPTRNATRLKGERTFAGVVDMILEEKGLAREPEAERF